MLDLDIYDPDERFSAFMRGVDIFTGFTVAYINGFVPLP